MLPDLLLGSVTTEYFSYRRIRMAHRMPEFHLAFHQARKARYVRTKEKREFEIQLSVDEIFRPAAKHRPQSQELSR